MAKELGMAPETMCRKFARWKKEGVASLLERRGGSRSANQKEEESRCLVEWAGRFDEKGRYNAHHAVKKFAKETGVNLGYTKSRELYLLQGWMKASPRRACRQHPSRERASRFGMLSQMDGSPHEWLPGFRCVLLLIVDDATSAILGGRFVESKSTFAYMSFVEEYFLEYGLPMAFYIDRAAVFKVLGGRDKDAKTQFGRALVVLDVEQIFALSPQAKGRIERFNRAAQDRLVKELYIHVFHKVKHMLGDRPAAMAAMNAYLTGVWIPETNAELAVDPAEPEDMHRELTQEQVADLPSILCVIEERKMDANGMLSYEGVRYKLKDKRSVNIYNLRSKPLIEIRHRPDGSIRFFKGLREIQMVEAPESRKSASKQVDGKGLVDELARKKSGYKPSEDHPWKRKSFQEVARKKGWKV